MKQQKQIALLASLLVLAAVTWYFSSKKPAAAAGGASIMQNYPPMAVENPQLHLDKLESSRKTEYANSHRNIFSPVAPPTAAEIKQQQKIQEQQQQVQTQQAINAPPPPPALPPNVKFFGYGTVPNGTARRAFFNDGDEVYIISEGETLLGKYRILRIGNASLEFEDVSTGRRGIAMLEQGPSA
jgi:hypothetical protein